MRTRHLLTAVAIGVVTATTFAMPASAQGPESAPPAEEELIGGIGLRLTEAPVSAADDPRARIYIVDHLAPGTVIERSIEVSNTAASSQHVALYAAAADITDGSFVGAAADTPNELSTWTSVTPEESDIAAGGVLEAVVTISVPSDAAPGEQYAVVWAEARSASSDGGGVVQVSRVGIRIYLSVGPGGAPAADFTIDSLTAGRSPDGQPTVSASVRNTGGRALDLNGSMTLSAGPGGLSAGPFPADLGKTLALGEVQPVSISLDDRLPAGPWTASITLESGLTKRTVEASITFPESGLAAPVAAEQGGESSPPLTLIIGAGVAGVLVLAVAILLVSRRRRRRASASRPGSRSGLVTPASTS